MQKQVSMGYQKTAEQREGIPVKRDFSCETGMESGKTGLLVLQWNPLFF
jgi:hypothetical protein